jgi:type I restriction enzyme S subunit
MNNWRTIRLGDVAKTSSGGTPKRTSPAYYGGGIPWVKSGELGDSTVYETSETISKAGLDGSSAKIFPKGTLCVALYGATVGKLGILGVDAATNQAVCGIFLPPEIDTRFAYRFLESKRRQLVESAKGGAQPNISQEIIRDLQFPLPPLLEQREIVAEIEKQFTRVDAGIAALRRTQANLKRYRAAVLKAACEGRLVPTEAELAKPQSPKQGSIPRKLGASDFESGAILLERMLIERRKKWPGSGKYKEATVIDAGTLPSLPDGWAWASMRQVGEVQLGRQRAPQHHTGDNMRPYLRVANVFEARIDTSDVKEMNFTPAEFERYQLRCGDILLNEGQTPELVGRPAMFRDEVAECCYQKTLLRFRAYEGVLPAFALTVFRSYMHNRRFTRAASITTNIAHLTAEKFVEIEFPLPPLAEQTRIEAEVERRLSVVEELETTVNANLQRATRLRQSVLQQAFRGHIAAQ